MSLTTRIIIFVVAVVAFVAAILATAARAQYAQDSWYEPPTKITVKMHRVTPHHHAAKRVKAHHHHARAGAKRLPAPSTKPSSRHGSAVQSRTGSSTLPTGAYPLITSQLYQEFITWCVIQALPCILPKGDP